MSNPSILEENIVSGRTRAASSIPGLGCAWLPVQVHKTTAFHFQTLLPIRPLCLPNLAFFWCLTFLYLSAPFITFLGSHHSPPNHISESEIVYFVGKPCYKNRSGLPLFCRRPNFSCHHLQHCRRYPVCGRRTLGKESGQLPEPGLFTISGTLLMLVCRSWCGKKGTCDFLTVAKSFVDCALKFQNWNSGWKSHL